MVGIISAAILCKSALTNQGSVSWIPLQYKQNLFGWTTLVQVNNQVLRAGINLAGGKCSLTRQTLDRIGFNASRTSLDLQFSNGQVVTSGISVVPPGTLHSAVDIIIGREAFANKIVQWDIPNERFSLPEIVTKSKFATTYSINGDRFQFQRSDYRLPGFFVASLISDVIPDDKNAKFPSGEPYTVKEDGILLARVDAKRSEVFEVSQSYRADVGNVPVSSASTFGDQVVTIDLKSSTVTFRDSQPLRTVFLLNLLSSIMLGYESDSLVLVKHADADGNENYRERGLLGMPIRFIGDLQVNPELLIDPLSTWTLLKSFQATRSYGVQKSGEIVWIGNRDKGEDSPH